MQKRVAELFKKSRSRSAQEVGMPVVTAEYLHMGPYVYVWGQRQAELA